MSLYALFRSWTKSEAIPRHDVLAKLRIFKTRTNTYFINYLSKLPLWPLVWGFSTEKDHLLPDRLQPQKPKEHKIAAAEGGVTNSKTKAAAAHTIEMDN